MTIHCDSFFYDNQSHYKCQLPVKHEGPHENGDWSWFDEAATPPAAPAKYSDEATRVFRPDLYEPAAPVAPAPDAISDEARPQVADRKSAGNHDRLRA